MTTLADILRDPVSLEHGLGMEEPKRDFRGWSILDGKNAALGLCSAGTRNVQTLVGYHEEMADLAFALEHGRG